MTRQKEVAYQKNHFPQPAAAVALRSVVEQNTLVAQSYRASTPRAVRAAAVACRPRSAHRRPHNNFPSQHVSASRVSVEKPGWERAGVVGLPMGRGRAFVGSGLMRDPG